MCDTAMHHEALRKKRLLERKAMAQQKMVEQQGGDMSCMPDGGQMEYGGAGMHEQSRMAPTYGSQRDATWNDIERQLKHEAKTLRDNNLYMGHPSCFKDLYDRNMLPPGK